VPDLFARTCERSSVLQTVSARSDLLGADRITWVLLLAKRPGHRIFVSLAVALETLVNCFFALDLMPAIFLAARTKECALRATVLLCNFEIFFTCALCANLSWCNFLK